ncbi:MAG: hypothetical protein SGPRY_002294 [Prymnesium sp.]
MVPDWGPAAQASAWHERMRKEEQFSILTNQPRLQEVWKCERPPGSWASASSLMSAWDRRMWIDRSWDDLKLPIRPTKGIQINSKRSVNPILGVSPSEQKETRDWLTSSQLQARGRASASPGFSVSEDGGTRHTCSEPFTWAARRPLMGGLQSKPRFRLSGAAVLLTDAPEPEPAAFSQMKARNPPTPKQLDRLLQRYSYGCKQRRFGDCQKSFDVINPLRIR